MEAPWSLGLQPVLIGSDSMFGLTVSLNSTASLHRVLLVIWSNLCNSNSLVDTIPYSINLTVSVDEFDKIFLFFNINFAVSLHFIELTLMYSTGDYKVVYNCGSSEVGYLAYLFILSGKYYTFRCTLHYRWLSRLHWLTFVEIVR